MVIIMTEGRARASRPELQIQLITQAAASPRERASFLANPGVYTEKKGVTLDKELIELIVTEFENIERKIAKLGLKNPFMKEKDIKNRDVQVSRIGAHPFLMALAALVSALASLVAAVAYTYAITKWFPPDVEPEDIPQQFGYET